MNRMVIAFGLIASTFAAKDALAQPVYPATPTQVQMPVPVERGEVYGGGAPAYDDRYDTRYDNRYDHEWRRERHNRWSYLAAVNVDGFRDRDVIHLGPHAGRYDRLMLVPQGRLSLRHAMVTFMNGETMSVDLRGRGRDGGQIVIDLPGERRGVASVQIFAGGGRYGHAQVALYGEHGSRRGGRYGWNR